MGRWNSIRRFYTHTVVNMESAVDSWPQFAIQWKDGGPDTLIRAKTLLEAEGIARRFAIQGGWEYTRVTRFED